MTEKNETPAENPAETPAPAPGEEKMRKSWHGCLFAALLLIASLFLEIILLPPLGQPSEKGYYMDCSSKLILLEKTIYWLTKVDKEREKPDNWSVCDLIRDDLSQYDGESRRGAELNLSCSKDHQAYLIFPVSAYIGLYEESVQPPVPVAMCHPGVHEKPGTPVLYSDGSVQVLSTADAEKLVREQSPAPLELKKPDFMTGRDAEP